MGFGDEIMALGEAQRRRGTDPRPVRILDKHGRPRRHHLWRGWEDAITDDPSVDAIEIVNGSGCRPYIDYDRSTEARWTFTAWRAAVARFRYLNPGLRGSAVVVIEPHVKGKASPNKQWGWHRWQALVDLLPTLDWAQLGPAGTPTLAGVRLIETDSFDHALHRLRFARAAVLPEGGLHHAAAALGVPAVVLFGGYIRPSTTGYDAPPNLPNGGARHINLAIDDPEALGWRVPHAACAAAWDRITPDLVAAHLTELLNDRSSRHAA